MFNNVKRDLMGIYISVPKEDQGKQPEELPRNVKVLKSILAKSQIPADLAFDEGMKADEFFLVLGNGPSNSSGP